MNKSKAMCFFFIIIISCITGNKLARNFFIIIFKCSNNVNILSLSSFLFCWSGHISWITIFSSKVTILILKICNKWVKKRKGQRGRKGEWGNVYMGCICYCLLAALVGRKGFICLFCSNDFCRCWAVDSESCRGGSLLMTWCDDPSGRGKGKDEEKNLNVLNIRSNFSFFP